MTIEAKIGYAFKDKALLALAFSHPSLPVARNALPENNQRLEFLGDAVLGLVIADMLYEMYPQEAEGDLAKRHSALVCGAHLADMGRKLSLGNEIVMSSSESESGGRDNDSNLEDACEALIGAIYLDGGMQAISSFIHAHWEEAARTTKAPPKDAKTALQEWAQGRGLPLPEYHVTGQSGPSHAPEFTVELVVKGLKPKEATAGSKKQAERAAAEMMLETID